MNIDLKYTEKRTSYDEVPYESQSFPQSHPDRLAMLARLFGLSPAPVTQCRVLELGCAAGGNLIPMAFHLPDSEFVGIDLSRRQIKSGHKSIQDLELQNISLKHASILDVKSTWGAFDYIICHGVYSWVTREVQEKIFDICSSNLAAQGIAYVSYNTYPGWHMREMIRRMMLYHANQFDKTKERIEQSRALMDFLANSVPTENNHYGMLLQSELDLIRKSSDSYLYHDHLEEVNDPVYFYQFIKRAEKHGLQYLADSEFATMLTSHLPGKVTETLKRISNNIISDEQYMDFVRNRHFRQTLLCHKGLKLKRHLDSKNLDGLLVASDVELEDGPLCLQPGEKQIFKTPDGITIETGHPLTKAGLTILGRQWPKVLDQKNLFEEACRYLDESAESSSMERFKEQQRLADDLLHCFFSKAVEFCTWRPEFISEVTNRPKVSKLALYQSRNKQSIVNQLHKVVRLDIVGQHLVRLLDGTRDHAALLSALKSLAEDGTLLIREGGKRVNDAEKIDDALKKAISQALSSLSKAAVLVA